MESNTIPCPKFSRKLSLSHLRHIKKRKSWIPLSTSLQAPNEDMVWYPLSSKHIIYQLVMILFLKLTELIACVVSHAEQAIFGKKLFSSKLAPKGIWRSRSLGKDSGKKTSLRTNRFWKDALLEGWKCKNWNDKRLGKSKEKHVIQEDSRTVGYLKRDN